MNKYQSLQKYFGYNSFREGQEVLVDAVLEGIDALGIMPTGGGKSLCYQLPATLLDGLTIVISPLISLMKDQVDALTEIGISATFINSSLTENQLRERVNNIFNDIYKIIYVAPERLNSVLFRSLIGRIKISLIAVDEAHCISKWGHDFRPSYGEIINFIASIPLRPVVAAYTATATPEVIDEIKNLLALKTPVESIIGFDRPNLSYEVLKVGNKLNYIEHFIKRSYPNEAGIIYCSTRKAVESVTSYLIDLGFSALSYHGGMNNDERNKNQNAFLLDQARIIVATNAFGMGIDKPNVRFVIHYNMPQNMEAYYQEAGRAGRDREPGHCLLMYSPNDIAKQKFLIENQEFEIDEERKRLVYRNLQYLIDYCHTDKCLRSQILQYFAETPKTDNCQNCSNCTNISPQLNITIEAQKILSCLYRVEQRYGINIIILILRGSKDRRILQNDLTKISTYGIMKTYSEKSIREMIMTLIARGYIFQTSEEFPILQLTKKSLDVLRGKIEIFHRQNLIQHRSSHLSTAKEEKFPINFDHDIYEKLRELRAEIAKKRAVPAFVIFHDSTLKEMAARLPSNKNMMLTIKGVGARKYDAYGEEFIQMISRLQIA